MDTITVSVDMAMAVQHPDRQPPQYLLSGLFCLKVWSHYVVQVSLKPHSPTTDLAFLHTVVIGLCYHVQLESTFSYPPGAGHLGTQLLVSEYDSYH